MNFLSMQELENLASPHEGWCISIYMPAVGKSQQVRQNPIRFKNLLDQAQDQLRKTGMDPTEMDDLFEPVEALLADGIFWQHQDDALVVFISKDTFQNYQLPMDVEETLIINDRFYLKPLLPMLHEDEEFYILTLSQKDVHLFKATEHTVEGVDVPNLPKNMQDTLGYESEEKSTPFYQAGKSGDRRGMFHGHNEGFDDRKEYILNFFRAVDKAVSGYLKDSDAPLVLACVEYLQPIYREANTYKNLSEDLIPGSPEGRKPELLRDEAWKMLKPIYQTTKSSKEDRYKMLAGRKDNRALKDVAEIVKAAPYGRVEVLFVNKNAKKWGKFDPDAIDVKFEEEPNPGNQDLLDFAAVQTLLNGGTVYVVDPQEMPESGSPAAAILRY